MEKSDNLNIRMYPETMNSVRALAKHLGKPVTHEMELLIELYLTSDGKILDKIKKKKERAKWEPKKDGA